MSSEELLSYIQQKVQDLFSQHSPRAHGIDHSKRVAENMKDIAQGEGIEDVAFAQAIAWVHDIGRVPEFFPEFFSQFPPGLRHPELSYLLFKQWLKEDSFFDTLSHEQKCIILYTIRYHWNNAAKEYDLAWILRDADKLDMFGDIGVQRLLETAQHNWQKVNVFFRYAYDAWYWIQTDTAKKILDERNLMKPVTKAYLQFLREKIEGVDLDD